MSDPALLEYLEGFISEERRQRFLEVLQYRTRHLTVAMEDVFQLHNTSAVLRSCEVFGIQELHLIENRFSKRIDKNISLGAQQWVDLFHYPDGHACMQALRSRGYAIVATTPDANAVSLDDFRPEQPCALFFGTEKEGLSEAILDAADTCLRIPMVGFTESLNISVAVGIILHQLSSWLRGSEVSWQLSEQEILEKRIDWTKKSIKSVNAILRRYHQIHGSLG